MKKLLGFLFCFLIATGIAFSATDMQKLPKQIKLKITFDWREPNEPFNNELIHIQKTILLNPAQTSYTIVTSETKANDRLPVTWALLLRPVDINQQQMTAMFMLVQYGLNQSGEIIAEPKVVFNNGQTAKILLTGDNSAIKLKVFSKWLK